MNLTDRAYIMLPDFWYLSKSNLKYLDTLTYLTVRSYLNKEMSYSFPPLAKIAKRSGLGTTFLNHSLKRLEAAGLIEIEHSDAKGTCNRYHFTRLKHYERIPYEIFDAEDLTTNEKAMLLCLRKFLMCTMMDLKELAEHIGVTHDTLRKQYKSLLKKDYIAEKMHVSKTRKKADIIRKLTNKIDWRYDYRTKQQRQAEIKYEPLIIH